MDTMVLATNSVLSGPSVPADLIPSENSQTGYNKKQIRYFSGITNLLSCGLDADAAERKGANGPCISVEPLVKAPKEVMGLTWV